MDNIEDSIPLGMQQLIDAESDGKIWLNSIPVVNELLDGLQRVAWHARIQQAKHDITAHQSAYLVNAKISELVQIFEGRNPAYAVLPWNSDPHQMKAYIMKQDDYWGMMPTLPMMMPCRDCSIAVQLRRLVVLSRYYQTALRYSAAAKNRFSLTCLSSAIWLVRS